jgi:glutaredoxin
MGELAGSPGRSSPVGRAKSGRIAIYTRPGCHLCDEMKATVRRVVDALSESIVVEEIDISGDRDLEARYGEEIPVLLINGRKSAKYRISATQLERLLEAVLTRTDA